jgi:polysaccharide export outer membrane protein
MKGTAVGVGFKRGGGLGALAGLGMLLEACASMATAPLATTALPPASEVYRLGLGDKLRVNVYGEPALSGEYQVSGNGVVAMPLIGDVKAVGLSARELEAALVARYAGGYLNSPRIAVEVFDFRPYFILGEVQRPGRFPTTEGTTVLSAIATAGGYTYRANRKKVYLRRAGESVEHEVSVSQNPTIAPGDVVRVGERYF